MRNSFAQQTSDSLHPALPALISVPQGAAFIDWQLRRNHNAPSAAYSGISPKGGDKACMLPS